MDRLSAMVSELLKLTNLERASRGERLSSGQLIRSAADQAAPQAEARSITILVDAAPCTLAGNAELLRQAVCNLVENAVKYSPPAALYTSRATGMGNGSKSWLPTRDPASRNRSASGFSSPFSGWMIPAPDSWAVPDLDWHWCGPSRSSTAALFMWKNPGEREADSS